ncbi:HAD-IIIC family phosphatase [Saccharospirillum impatiens]|uniref:HAD-IIIC family phosphatase n=1 Tax=Saccharospirillum impatiens TaxID=169438 RepID=UPI0004068B0D|nr:HAD-IIIC family phosphatase [Saccharospirillum impatiens]
MKYLQAHRAVSALSDDAPATTVLLVTSFQSENLDLYLQARHAVAGKRLVVDHLPFNTLAQLSYTDASQEEIWLMLPWDWLPETNWRTGLPPAPLDLAEVETRLAALEQRLQQRGVPMVYLDAPIPPVMATDSLQAQLRHRLREAAYRVGARLIDDTAFDLTAYLNTGVAIAGRNADDVAGALYSMRYPSPKAPRKVLVTDLDQVMWHGIIGEDGIDGIQYRPEGAGYPHFLYQQAVQRLKQSGTLIAAVSRNDADLAKAPFEAGQMTLNDTDLVAILGSYQPKSAQIQHLLEQLSLGLDAVVFVDDNPVELSEVSTALPEIQCLRFPGTLAEFPGFLSDLLAHFEQDTASQEDTQRTELYRTRLKGMAPVDARGADLTAFLASLDMTLTWHDRNETQRDRALQLINKTNQFNLNGIRWTDDELDAVLTSGGHLFSASLTDAHGEHGEIMACLIDVEGRIGAWVMSCRVLQRQVEAAFLNVLAEQLSSLNTLYFERVDTERNKPLQNFLATLTLDNQGISCDGLHEKTRTARTLFTVNFDSDASRL